jgi:hypothetical protein
MTYPCSKVLVFSHLDPARSGTRAERERERAVVLSFLCLHLLRERRQKNTHNTYARYVLAEMTPCRFCFNRFFGDPSDDCDYPCAHAAVCISLLLNATSTPMAPEKKRTKKWTSAHKKTRLKRQTPNDHLILRRPPLNEPTGVNQTD